MQQMLGIWRLFWFRFLVTVHVGGYRPGLLRSWAGALRWNVLCKAKLRY